MQNKAPTRTPIFIHANCLDDIPLIAGLAQDAMFPVMDTEYRKSDSIFVMVINRFIWEWDTKPYARTHAILHFEQVLCVESQDIHIQDGRIYTILSIIPVPAKDNTIWLYISLAGGESIRIKVQDIDIVIKDVGQVWHTPNKPNHQDMILEN